MVFVLLLKNWPVPEEELKVIYVVSVTGISEWTVISFDSSSRETLCTSVLKLNCVTAHTKLGETEKNRSNVIIEILDNFIKHK